MEARRRASSYDPPTEPVSSYSLTIANKIYAVRAATTTTADAMRRGRAKNGRSRLAPFPFPLPPPSGEKKTHRSTVSKRGPPPSSFFLVFLVSFPRNRSLYSLPRSSREIRPSCAANSRQRRENISLARFLWEKYKDAYSLSRKDWKFLAYNRGIKYCRNNRSSRGFLPAIFQMKYSNLSP